jgi:hypothetical protein
LEKSVPKIRHAFWKKAYQKSVMLFGKKCIKNPSCFLGKSVSKIRHAFWEKVYQKSVTLLEFWILFKE